jgi:DNA-directed RNA polymerase subunit RPC12/RpoP
MKFFKKLFQKHVIINIPGPLISVVPENCYATSVKCGNCGENLSLFIKKGIYIKYVITSVRCTHCGCKVDREIK